MRVNSLASLGFFLLSLLFVFNSCNADDKTFDVVGYGECADCKENNFTTSQAFSGLHVTIDCKPKAGEIKRVGASELDNQGKFKVSLPQDLLQDGQKLKQDCYAQLHSAAAAPCPAHNGLEASKIVLKSQTGDKPTFGPTKNLQFSTALCTSKFSLPYFKYRPLPKPNPKKKNLPQPPFPKIKNFGHPWPLPPLYKHKPLFPPKYKPPVPKPPAAKPLPKYKPPVAKPLPPPVPIHNPFPKPPVPVHKPLPKPPAPFHKPFPKPPVIKPPLKTYPPVHKPLPPPVPVYKPPVVTEPLPPPITTVHPTFPTFYKKRYPPLPKLSPFPKIPPKYFKHPKLGYVPPLPSSIPHP